MDVKERFLAVVEDIQRRTSMSQSELERRCGMSSVVSNIRAGKVEPSLSTVAKLLTTFPDYSTDWLVLGKDKMLKADGEFGQMKRENESLLRLNIELQKRLNEDG